MVFAGRFSRLSFSTLILDLILVYEMCIGFGKLNLKLFENWAPLMVVYFCVQLTDKSKYKNEWYLGNIAFLSSQLMPLKLMGLFVQCLLFLSEQLVIQKIAKLLG